MNSRSWRNPAIILVLALLAVLIFIVIGALLARASYLTRGITNGLPEPISNGGARLGVNTSLNQYGSDQLEAVLQEISASGFSAIKQSFYYSEDFDWEASDRIIQAVNDAGLMLTPLLDGRPEDKFAPPDDLERFASWAGDFAERYKDDVTYYIIWDEPNLSEHWGGRQVNAAEYAAILTSAASRIRTFDPEAVIVAAPLAPTTETGPDNVSDHLYLQALYESGIAGAFDVISAKPYGFDSPPADRDVDPNKLNFSRVILLREVMERNGDADKAIWAGNWGWNSLPDNWRGNPSIWGQIDGSDTINWAKEGFERARREWPWMGYMFIENWEPDASTDDPRWGFSISGTEAASALGALNKNDETAYPAFHLADPEQNSQNFDGDWRFSQNYGADVGDTGDSASLNFWGTDIGLRVRRADFHGRFYVTVDGMPANALPSDENGSALVLNSPDPNEDYVTNELLAAGLEPGEHEVVIQAHRGTDQWALNGFTVAYKPDTSGLMLAALGLGLLAIVVIAAMIWIALITDWGDVGSRVRERFDSLDQRIQLGMTTLAAIFVALAGWLTWGEQAAALYRRLGDGGQLAITATAASILYFAPSILLYGFSSVILLLLVYLRPAWGLAITVFSIPFYVKPKPVFGFQFSPVEIFLLITTAAVILRWAAGLLNGRSSEIFNKRRFISADYAALFFVVVATLSLFFTERLDVATNEWRVVIIEPVILYFLLRLFSIKETEMWTILDAFILGAVVMAIIGLWQYLSGENLITSEGGLMRLRSVYGSPNNVALYLGRIFPLLAAFVLMGRGRRRLFYGLCLLIATLALLLTFSKGALFIGIPISLLVILVYWRLDLGGRLWPWLTGFAAAAVIILFALFQIPQTAERFNLQGATGFLRLNLWQASLNMFLDHPIFGVGLDNFLYEYRGRYLLDAAWKEPNLNHPHNLILDLTTRLGLFGLISGLWLIWSYWSVSHNLPFNAPKTWKPVSVGLVAVLFALLAHGMVDHSLFLVDLSFAFFFLFGLGVWIKELKMKSVTHSDMVG